MIDIKCDTHTLTYIESKAHLNRTWVSVLFLKMTVIAAIEPHRENKFYFFSSERERERGNICSNMDWSVSLLLDAFNFNFERVFLMLRNMKQIEIETYTALKRMHVPRDNFNGFMHQFMKRKRVDESSRKRNQNSQTTDSNG